MAWCVSRGWRRRLFRHLPIGLWRRPDGPGAQGLSEEGVTGSDVLGRVPSFGNEGSHFVLGLHRRALESLAMHGTT